MKGEKLQRELRRLRASEDGSRLPGISRVKVLAALKRLRQNYDATMPQPRIVASDPTHLSR